MSIVSEATRDINQPDEEAITNLITDVVDEPMMTIVLNARWKYRDILLKAKKAGVAADDYFSNDSIEQMLLDSSDIRDLHDCGRSLFSELEWKLIRGEVPAPKAGVTPMGCKTRFDVRDEAIAKLHSDVSSLIGRRNVTDQILNEAGLDIGGGKLVNRLDDIVIAVGKLEARAEYAEARLAAIEKGMAVAK